MRFTEHLGTILPRLIPMAFWVCVGLYIIYRRNHPVERSPLEKAILRGVGIAFGLVILIGAGIVMKAIHESILKNKVTAANSQAHMIGNAFTSSVAELDQDGLLPLRSEELISGRVGDDAPEGTLAFCMNQYCNDGDYYVVVTDGDWNIRYTLWSRKPITVEEIHPYTVDAQRRFLRRLFQDDKELVGYYSYEER